MRTAIIPASPLPVESAVIGARIGGRLPRR
jgi:hypothetical protein